jgi:hypothetical protein
VIDVDELLRYVRTQVNEKDHRTGCKEAEAGGQSRWPKPASNSPNLQFTKSVHEEDATSNGNYQCKEEIALSLTQLTIYEIFDWFDRLQR